MSRYVKELVAGQIAKRLEGVEDALLVNLVGLDANQSSALRKHLRSQGIELMLIKNSMGRMATEGTSLAAAFDSLDGTNAIVWGAEDFISLAKEIVKLDKSKDYEEFKATGGVMDGEQLTPETVHAISKWPNRLEQLSIISGQLLSPGSKLASQLTGPGAKLASQFKKMSGDE